jgi:hypothetical protein
VNNITSIKNKDIQMLAEALNTVFAKAKALGIDFGSEQKTVEAVIKTAKIKPETKTEKVDKYKTALVIGKRFSKHEILNRI